MYVDLIEPEDDFFIRGRKFALAIGAFCSPFALTFAIAYFILMRNSPSASVVIVIFAWTHLFFNILLGWLVTLRSHVATDLQMDIWLLNATLDLLLTYIAQGEVLPVVPAMITLSTFALICQTPRMYLQLGLCGAGVAIWWYNNTFGLYGYTLALIPGDRAPQEFIWLMSTVALLASSIVGAIVSLQTRECKVRINKANAAAALVRDTTHAPKDGSQPFTILFTDVEGSTGLWSEVPEAMSAALDAHHEGIRTLIRKHGCYEVKTVGDSFMIACHSPTVAVSLACDIQIAMYNTQATEINEAYSRLLGSAPVNIEDSTANDASLWSGLRVRIGIHEGTGDIVFDQVSKGYDYYGTVVNTSARVVGCAHGGQILITRDIYEKVQFIPEVYIVALGPVPLRGVGEMELYQVLPAMFKGRVFDHQIERQH
jgi:class 3 adenylate cyclase